jgi:hypothetical protein
MNFLSNRKSLMKLGKLATIVLSLFVLGFLVFNFVLPAFADVTPGMPPGRPSVWVNTSATGAFSGDKNQTDEFFTCNNVVRVLANISCNNPTVCNESMVATANYTGITNSWKEGVLVANLSNTTNDHAGWREYEFNGTVDCSQVTISSVQFTNITVNVSTYDTASTDIGWASALLVNMSMPGCPPAGENVQIPPMVPLLNGSIVNTTGRCITTCTGDDHAQFNHSNSTHGDVYNLCGPNFGGDSINFTSSAYNGNFSAIPLVLDIPGKVKINFTVAVNFSDQQKTQAIMQFAMKNMMSGGRVGVNESEWNGGGGKPDLRLTARLTLYNVSGRFGIPASSVPSIGYRSNYGSGNFGACPAGVCGNFTWDGQNLTFTVSGFSEYDIGRGLGLVLSSPSNISNITNGSFVSGAPFRNVNFTYTPTWNSTTTERNATLWGNFTGSWAMNSSNATSLANGTLNGINLTLNGEGNYVWNVILYDTSGGSDQSTVNWTFTVDTVKPVLYDITPANSAFIYGTTSQLFQVSFDDTYANRTNVTVFHKKGETAWKSASLTCYNTTTANQSFICNKTLDMTEWYENGNTVSYYFVGTDSAANYGSNGTASSPLTLKLDQIAPQYSNLVNSTNPSIYARNKAYQFNATWTDNNLMATVLIEHNFTGTLANYTVTTNESSVYYYNYNDLKTADYVYRWIANDTVVPIGDSNKNATSQATFIVNKNTSTSTYLHLKLNGTADVNANYTYPDAVNATAYTDIETEGAVILYRNDSDVLATEENIRLANATYNYTVYYAATANYSAAQVEYLVRVNKGTVTLNLALNGTEGNKSYVYPEDVNATGWKSATIGSEFNLSLYRDGNIVATTLTANSRSEQIRLANATYNYTLVFNGSVNYTDTALNISALINKGFTILTLKLNDTEADLTIASGAYANISASVNHTLEGNIYLYRDNAQYNTSSSLVHIDNISTYHGIPATIFNITGSYVSGGNYTDASTTRWATVESTAPQWSNIEQNVTNGTVIGKYNGSIAVMAKWSDYELRNYWISTNETSTWVNASTTNFAAGNWSNMSIDPSGSGFVAGRMFQAKIYANDTSSNQNSTQVWQWTVDGTAPILNNPTPVNGTYVYGTTAQLFQVYAYDDTLNTSNVTVYHRKGATAWKSASLTCYNTTTANQSFICNKTLDMTEWYENGDTVSYYFKAPDLSRIYGNNGTVSDPLTVTLEQRAPQYFNNETNRTTIGKNDGVLISAYWTDVDTLDKAVLETNETGTAINKTADYGSVKSMSGQTSWSNFSWTNSSVASGAVIQWRVFANDTVGNENVTAAGTFIVDGTAPQINYNDTNVTNNSVVAKGTAIRINVQWTDNVALDKWEVYADTALTGGSLNGGLSGISAWGNATIATSDLAVGTTIRANVTANDTTNNRNYTLTFQWTIDNTLPQVLAQNTNTTNASTIAKGSSILVTGNWTDDIGLNTYKISHNETGIWGNTTSVSFAPTNYSNSTGIVNTSSSSLGATFQIIMYAIDTSGNENASEMYQYTVDNTLPQVLAQNTNTSNATTIARGASILVGGNWTDNIGLNTYKISHNETGAWGNTTAATFAATNYSNSTGIVNTSSSSLGATFQIIMYAIDTSGNENASEMYQYTIDGTAPEIGNITSAVSSPVTYTPGRTYLFNATAADNITVGTVLFEWNGTNYSATLASTNNYSYPLTDLKVSAVNYTYRWFANDTSGNGAFSSTYTFNVTQNTTNNVDFYWNTTANSNGTYVYPQDVNATAALAVNGTGTANLYRNDSLILGGTEQLRIGAGFWLYQVNVTGNENYTSNSTGATFNVTVSQGVSNISLWLNDTQGDKSIEQGVPANFTATINTSYSVSFSIITNITSWGTKTNTTTRLQNTTSTSGFSGDVNVTAWFDGDNNYTADKQTNYLTVSGDNTAPTVLVNYTLTFENGTYARSGAGVIVNISVTDLGVGMGTGATCNVTIGGTVTTNLTYSGTTSSGWCNGTVTVPSGTDGNNTFNVTVGDTNGNVGKNDTLLVSIDNTPPVINVSTPLNASYMKIGGGNRVWINGTVSDNLLVNGNVTANYSNFTTYSFTAENYTNYAIWNGSLIADGYIAITVNVTDKAGNIGNATVYLFEDNTAPSAAYGLTNSTYGPTTTQTVQVRVLDALQTTQNMTLVYSRVAGTWENAVLTGTPGTDTTYSATINTGQLANGATVLYYLVGTDNATNNISSTEGGSSSSPLNNFTISSTGSIDGYVLKNGTTTGITGATVSDGTRAAVTNSNGYYIIPNVPTGSYTVMATATDYTSNSTSSVSVTAGSTTRANITMAYTATGIVQGYVKVNGTNTVLVGATVSDGTRAAITNNDGFYQISNVPAGTYTVTANLTNYVGNSSSATVTAGSTTNLNITLANNATGIIQGYIRLTNTTIAPNATYSITVSDGTRTVNPNTAGFYQITGVPAGTYTLTVAGVGYWSNTSSVTVTTGSTTNQNMTVTGAENFNVTIPGTVGSSNTGFYDSGWHQFFLSTQVFSAGTTNYTIANLFTSIESKYTIIYRYNVTQGWKSYLPDDIAHSTFTTINSTSDQYYINMNATDRVEIERTY